MCLYSLVQFGQTENDNSAFRSIWCLVNGGGHDILYVQVGEEIAEYLCLCLQSYVSKT